MRNVLEVLVDGLAGLARETMGDEWRKYFPLVGTIFVFVMVSNVIGLLPGIAGPTSDINTTAAWAICAFSRRAGPSIAFFKCRRRSRGTRYWLRFIASGRP